MSPLYDNIETLVAKQLAGEITPEEGRALSDWMGETPENQAYYDRLARIWAASPQANSAVSAQFDTEAALQRVKKRLAPERATAAPLRANYFMRYAAAAAIALALLAVWWLRNPVETAQMVVSAPPNEVLNEGLPDGTAVTLNRNSGLTLQSGFNKKERRVVLQGEAYFEVAPNPEKPFVVRVDELEVRVLGTAFNVDASSVADRIAISVDHGRVGVSIQGQNLELTAGQQAIFERSKGTLRLLEPAQQNPNTTAYKNRVFQFDATPLRDVVAMLNKAYGSNIQLQGTHLADCALTARYNNLPIERVLELVTASFSIKYQTQPNGVIVLIGTGCE